MDSFPRSALLFLLVTAMICFENCLAKIPQVTLCYDHGNYTNGSQQEKNVHKVWGDLLGASSQARAFNISVSGQGGSEEAIYGLLQCFGNTNASLCRQCAKDAVSAIQEICGTALGARVWLDDCYFRFANSNFTGQIDTYPTYYLYVNKNATDVADFDKTVQHLLSDLNSRALKSPATRYASGFVDSRFPPVYAFVQCYMDISMDDCISCLSQVMDGISGFSKIGNLGARVLTGSCFNRYEDQRFFPLSPPPTPLPGPSLPNSSNSTTVIAQLHTKKSTGWLAVILPTAGGFLLMLLVFFCGCFLGRRRSTIVQNNRPTAREVAEQEESDDLVDEDPLLIFSMEELMAATNDFDENLKLGEGGFGAVYKGTLDDGKKVAVKKLYIQSAHGQQEFLNEINVLARIQHRNLINLVGCCIEGSHRILVYDFLPNNSLDKFLFDPQPAKFLDWEKRYSIILGVARGLMYLHEDSRVKIVHRDIKAANILLDEEFNPKVADFGIAKLFKEDESHMQTRIAGTYGYMAPEYALQGQLSSNADVYSFGVLVLEIVSGKKSMDGCSYEMNLQSLVEWAWRLHQEQRVSTMIEEAIKASCIMEQVIRCINVALLCTQAQPSLRPTMSRVVVMLSSAYVTLVPPAFMMSSPGHAPIQKIPTNGANMSISELDPR